jgi:spore coat polysaccharide biosynthesis protein SpsF
MGSSRLPGKVLATIAGKSMLQRVVERARRARSLDGVAVATSYLEADDEISAEVQRLDMRCIRGHPTDVLDRYRQAAVELQADVVVRITADCPLIDSNVLDLVVVSFAAAEPQPDYASNVVERSYPHGLDVEVFSRDCLEDTARRSAAPHEREHVTPFMLTSPHEFRLLSVRNHTDYGAYRWTVDETEDLSFVRAVYSRLAPSEDFGWQSVVELLEREPELAEINSSVVQRSMFHTAT